MRRIQPDRRIGSLPLPWKNHFAEYERSNEVQQPPSIAPHGQDSDGADHTGADGAIGLRWKRSSQSCYGNHVEDMRARRLREADAAVTSRFPDRSHLNTLFD